MEPLRLVSVILPTYGRTAYVAAAIDSVCGQTYTHWELIVADDGSAEDTRDYLRSLSDNRISVILLPHSGNPSKVRNAAIRQARGDYLAFLDSDDIWSPAKLAVQLDAMRLAPRRRWSYSAVTQISPEGHVISDTGVAAWQPLDGNIVEALIRFDALLATPAVMAERSLVEEVGGFDEAQRFGEDYDLWLRLALKSDVVAVDRRLVCVRNTGGDGNYGRDRIGAHDGWVQWYDKLARSLEDPRLRMLARERRAESALMLAGLYADAGRPGDALRTLITAARRGSISPAWWWRAAKVMTRWSTRHRRVD